MKSWTADNGYTMNSNDRDDRLKKILHRLPIEDGKYICRLIYSDPLKDIYWLLLIIYVLILAGFILWPFDFYVYVKNDARWIGSSKGIGFLETGQAVSNSSTHEFLVVMENKCIILFCHQLFVQNVNQLKYQRVTLLMRFSTISNSVNYLWRYLSEFIKKTLIFSIFYENNDKYS